jgi:HD-GYP domain-containing protein (c-di-GMP phosphodiesterase class II)
LGRNETSSKDRGIVLFQRGLSLAARDVLADWYKDAKDENNIEEQYQALYVIGSNWLALNRPADALDSFETMQLLIDEGELLPDQRQSLLINLALAHDAMANLDRALYYAEKAWAVKGGDCNPGHRAKIALMLGHLYIAKEEWDQAYKNNDKARNLFDLVGNIEGKSKALNNMGMVCVETGQYGQGRSLLEESLELKRSIGNTRASTYTLTELGRLYFRQGDLAMAIHYGSRALELIWNDVALMDKAEVARLCRLFGSVAAMTGDRQSANSYLQRAITYYAQSNLWGEWSATTKELEALVYDNGHSGRTRVCIEIRDKDRMRYLTTLLGCMDTMESLYPEARGESELVTKYVLILGDACGVKGEERKVLSHAARLADVGLTFESTTGRHQDLDTNISHPLLSEKFLRMLSVSPECIASVRHHHEHYDGSGYPDGLKGEEIPLASRILLLVNDYIDMATAYDLGNVKLHEQHLNNLIKKANTVYDRKLVETFYGLHKI